MKYFLHESGMNLWYIVLSSLKRNKNVESNETNYIKFSNIDFLRI